MSEDPGTAGSGECLYKDSCRQSLVSALTGNVEVTQHADCDAQVQRSKLKCEMSIGTSATPEVIALVARRQLTLIHKDLGK